LLLSSAYQPSTINCLGPLLVVAKELRKARIHPSPKQAETLLLGRMPFTSMFNVGRSMFDVSSKRQLSRRSR
jgi:hypothetical protein